MSDVMFVLAVALGVAVAVVYPTLRRYIFRQFPTEASVGMPSWLKAALKKYGALLAFSLIAAIILVAVFRTDRPGATIGFWPAVVLGFGFEASIEKIIFPKTDTGKRRKPPTIAPPEASPPTA